MPSTPRTPPRQVTTIIRKFFRTPKGLLIIVLAVLVAVATDTAGIGLVAPGLAGALGAAVLIDVPILRMRKRRWVFPDGALLTGLIVVMILSPHERWSVAAITTGIAVLSKYVLRLGPANIFNPAALALIASYFLFDTEQSWWGALPEVSSAAVVILLATGVFITIKVNKIPIVLAFLLSYYLLVTLSAFLGDPGKVAELYRTPDLQAALFFAFFMVTDPPTSPPGSRDQLLFGMIAALVGYAAFELIGAVYYLLAGLLVANAWEAWRRARVRAGKAAASLRLKTQPD